MIPAEKPLINNVGAEASDGGEQELAGLHLHAGLVDEILKPAGPVHAHQQAIEERERCYSISSRTSLRSSEISPRLSALRTASMRRRNDFLRLRPAREHPDDGHDDHDHEQESDDCELGAVAICDSPFDTAHARIPCRDIASLLKLACCLPFHQYGAELRTSSPEDESP